jgi:hypothetical protein
MTQERQPSYVDLRMKQLREQEQAREALVRRSPPPPPGYTPIQLREYLLAKRRLDAKGSNSHA